MSVCDGRPPRPNPEPWPEGRVPTNNLERLIASAPRPPEKPPAAPKAPDSHVIPPPRGTGSQQEVTRLDILSLIHSQCHRVYASAIDREDIDTKYMAEIEEALRAVYADAELARRGRAQGGNTSENSGLLDDSKTAETRMGSSFEGGHLGLAPAAGTGKNAARLYQARPRGIGNDWTPGCMCCGGEKGLHKNISFFVPSRETGEAIVAMFKHGAFLDWREHEPNWIQVKVGACDAHLENLRELFDGVQNGAQQDGKTCISQSIVDAAIGANTKAGAPDTAK